MLRWLVILLMVAVPLRSGMAAMQICPWMAAGLAVQTSAATGPASAAAAPQAAVQAECEGMSAADGHCTLSSGCAATPLVSSYRVTNMPQAMPVHTAWHRVYSLFTYSPVPQRVPITLS